MSSRVFVAELAEDRRLSKWLVVSVVVASAAGFWVVMTLPLSSVVRGTGAAGWLLATLSRAAIFMQTLRRYPKIRLLADGTAMLQRSDGVWLRASIGPSCVVLSGLAWLELRLSSGGRYFGLFAGNSRESEQWRRLQVIWRHMGSGS